LDSEFPNPGVKKNVKEVDVHESNYFVKTPKMEIRRKYMQYSVFMEAINNTLGLPITSSLDDFAKRVNDLIEAARKV